jgi:hypothetical protein
VEFAGEDEKSHSSPISRIRVFGGVCRSRLRHFVLWIWDWWSHVVCFYWSKSLANAFTDGICEDVIVIRSVVW